MGKKRGKWTMYGSVPDEMQPSRDVVRNRRKRKSYNTEMKRQGFSGRIMKRRKANKKWRELFNPGLPNT